jgi:Ca2+-binding RTX toxin-like protein
VIKIKESGETLRVSYGITSKNVFNSSGIQRIEFADGTMLKWAELEKAAIKMPGTDANDNISASYFDTIMEGFSGDDYLYGNTGDDALYGGEGADRLDGTGGNDLLDGLTGNDILTGGEGDDVFVFGRGYGNDVVNAGDNRVDKCDVIRLVGLNRGDVEFLAVPVINNSRAHDFVIKIKESGETLRVSYGIVSKNVFNSSGIQRIEFADGTMLEWAELEKNAIKMLGTDANDNISASYFDTIMEGFSGDDYLYGNTGNDVLYGGEGADRLDGKGGNNIMDGGAGNDVLTGRENDDIYFFQAGGGQDIINNYGGNDTLKFKDINPAELWFGKSGDHLTIGLIGTADKVTVHYWFASANYQIDTIEAGDMAITENQVALMVQAMASVGAPGGVNGQWTDEQRDALAPVLASYWQPKA